jgi:hypothetical protein
MLGIHFTLVSIPLLAYSARQNTRNLPVKAVKSDQKYELIPSGLLRRDFPVVFVDEFVHWYDINDDCLEFRPIKVPWTPSPDNWR